MGRNFVYGVMSFGGNDEFGAGRRDIEYVDRAVINKVLPPDVGRQRRPEERITAVFFGAITFSRS